MPLTKASYAMITGAVVNVKDYGAVGDNLTDDTEAIQAAFDYSTTNGASVYFPQGTYVISDTVTLLKTIAGQSPLGGDTKACIFGDGSGLSVLRWTGGNKPALKIEGEVISLQTVKGIGLLSSAGAVVGSGTGIYLHNLSWFQMEDVLVTGFEFGIDAYSVISTNMTMCVVRANRFGVRFQPDATGVFVANPNAISMVDCDIGLNTEWGAYIVKPGNFNIRGGAIQGNGQGGVLSDKWGIRVDNAGAEAAVGVNLIGVYFEANVGLADVYLYQSDFSGIHNLIGCSFTRIADNYATHCIRYDNNVAVVSKLGMYGNAFLSGPGYTPNAGRSYVNVAYPSSANFQMTEFASFYSSSVENIRPIGNQIGNQSTSSAWLVYGGISGSVVQSFNVNSVTKLSTGVYEVALQTPMSSANYLAIPSVTASSGFAYISNKLTTSFQIHTLDFSGSPADLTEVSCVTFSN